MLRRRVLFGILLIAGLLLLGTAAIFAPFSISEPPVAEEVHILGVFKGWTVISDPVDVPGTIVDFHQMRTKYCFVRRDYDWNVVFRPDDQKYLYYKDELGENTDGTMELEIEPAGRLSDKNVIDEYMGPLKGHHVTVNGAWVNDDAHGKAKTEIHPVHSILDLDANGVSTLMVLSEAATNRACIGSIHSPDAGETVSARFTIDKSPLAKTVWLRQENRAASFRVTGGNVTDTFLQIEVNTGRPDAGQGFFYQQFSFAESAQGFLVPPK